MTERDRDPKVPINPILLSRARGMRSEPTRAEAILWSSLRNRQLGGFKFRRQVPLGVFIADFYCVELKLIVEVDGISHFGRVSEDVLRSEILRREGNFIIRFFDGDVIRFRDEVLEAILLTCERISRGDTPSP